MNIPKFRPYTVPDVQEVLTFIYENSLKDNRLNNFHRSYFRNSLNRLSMSVDFINNAIQQGWHYLDVGSFGILPVMVKKQNPDCTIHCLSYEGNRIGLGEDGFYETVDPNDADTIRIDQVDVEHDTFPYEDDCFDFISCFEILEHLKFSPIAMMQEIKRVLKPGGILALTTPNINSSKSMLKMICGESPQECPNFHNNINYGVIHPKEYTIEEIRELFFCLGFTVHDLYTIDTTPRREEENVIESSVMELLEKLREQSSLAIFKPQFGEKIVAIGINSDDIKSLYPEKLYDASGS